MQKRISPAGTAPSANIFTNPIMHIHSQHPYLLGFDSNLIPNSHILVFQPYPGEDSKYSENREDSHIVLRLPLGIPRIIGKIVSLVLFFQKDTAGSTANTEYVEYLPYSDRNTQIIGKFYKFFSSVHYRDRIH